MALSEREQQAFEQLEQALYQQDPIFAHRVRLEHAWFDARHRLELSIVGLVMGLGLMLTFCLTTSVVLGIAGFLVMAVSLDTSWTKIRRMIEAGADEIACPRPTKGPAADKDTRLRLRHWFGHSH